jgi:capsid protein
MTFKAWDPQHPSTAYGQFVKDNKRGQAYALGVAYPSFGNDPGDANFSSMRVGLVEERESYRIFQRVIREHILEDIFEDWLFTALSFGRIGNLPLSKFEKFNQAQFVPREWDWLDPKADADALAIAEDRGWKSPSQIVARTGRDEEDVLAEIEATHDRRAALGLITQPRLNAGAEAVARTQQAANQVKPALATSLGVGGTQALVTFLQSISMPDNAMSEDAILTTLVDVFGMDSASAKKLAKKKPVSTPPIQA